MSLAVEMLEEVIEEVKDTETVQSLSTLVNGTGPDGKQWKEVAQVFSFTSSGLGFYMDRQCTVGNLISLKTKLPPHMRFYDHDSKTYDVWGLVQYCHMSTQSDALGFQVGV